MNVTHGYSLTTPQENFMKLLVQMTKEKDVKECGDEGIPWISAGDLYELSAGGIDMDISWWQPFAEDSKGAIREAHGTTMAKRLVDAGFCDTMKDSNYCDGRLLIRLKPKYRNAHFEFRSDTGVPIKI
jgi:hypothetical protein